MQNVLETFAEYFVILKNKYIKIILNDIIENYIQPSRIIFYKNTCVLYRATYLLYLCGEVVTLSNS